MYDDSQTHAYDSQWRDQTPAKYACASDRSTLNSKKVIIKFTYHETIIHFLKAFNTGKGLQKCELTVYWTPD